MKKLLTIAVIFLLAFSALAQEDTSELDPDANECFAGGTMEGRCNTDVNQDGEVSQEEIDWAWNCGWYMARFNAGVYGREGVPSWCSVLLPSIAEKPIEADVIGFDCGIFFGGGYTICIKGNYLKQDSGNDGSFETDFYMSKGKILGDDGNCPAGTIYNGEVGDYSASEPAFYAFMVGKGFGDYDNICIII